MSNMNGQLQVTVAKLYEEIGRLTVENALLRQQLAAAMQPAPIVEDQFVKRARKS